MFRAGAHKIALDFLSRTENPEEVQNFKTFYNKYYEFNESIPLEDISGF